MKQRLKWLEENLGIQISRKEFVKNQKFLEQLFQLERNHEGIKVLTGLIREIEYLHEFIARLNFTVNHLERKINQLEIKLESVK